MTDNNMLDVTKIEPRLKHPAIFEHFDALQEGEAFVIHNDHDPKPLYYQLLAERGDIFSWQYLQQGPEVWEIKIAKRNLDNGEETIGNIAAKDVRKAEVFKRYGLDFCCGGNKSLKKACEEAGVSVSQVENALEHLPKGSEKGRMDFNNWESGFLADYIVNIHHKYVTDSIPMLSDLSERIALHHGSAHPELYEIRQHVTALLAEMRKHQAKEEKVLFPFIKKLEEYQKDEDTGNPLTETVESPVRTMIDEHDAAGRHLHAMEKLSDNYSVPADGCESYKLYYHKLREFDDDMHQHIHLENNILFPKAVKLEKSLTN